MQAKHAPNKQPHQLLEGEWSDWHGAIYAHCPGPGKLLANLGNHTVTYPQDEVLHVFPSILCDDGRNRFHGYIENGIWLGEDRQPIK
jgi:hypothetical protein